MSRQSPPVLRATLRGVAAAGAVVGAFALVACADQSAKPAGGSGAASSTAIRALIKQLVGAEDVKKPLSDSKIAEMLGEQGIVVARRTIAKYRESLRIPPVSLRKTL